MQLDETHLALAYSIPTSNRTSALHRTANLQSALVSTNLVLPIGGFMLDGNDALLIFPNAELTETSPEWLGQTLGDIQNKLDPF